MGARGQGLLAGAEMKFQFARAAEAEQEQEKPDAARGGPDSGGQPPSGSPDRRGRQGGAVFPAALLARDAAPDASRPSGDDPGGSPGAAAARQSLVASGSEEEEEQEAETAQGSQGTQGPSQEHETSQDEARRCTVCNLDRPRHAFSPIQWAGRKSGTRARRCMKCVPKTAPKGQRYCTQCDRAKPNGQFGPNQDGKVVKVCRSCSTQQARLSFFINGTPSE